MPFYLIAAEQRYVFLVELQLAQVVWHVLRDERLCLLVDRRFVNQYFADVAAEVIAQRTHDNVAFLIDQRRCFGLGSRVADGFPGFGLIVEIPLQFVSGATDTGGAHNNAHAVGDFEFIHRRFEFAAIVAFDTTRYATSPWIVGHQDQEPARQANKCS